MFVIYYIELNTKYKVTKKNNRNGSVRYKTESNYPQHPCGQELPKYGSQSETTIDSCPIENYTRPKTKKYKKNIEKGT